MTEFKNPFESKDSNPEKALQPEGAFSGGFIESLVQDFISLVRGPRIFLQSIDTHFATGKALAYGVLCHWFGTAGQLLFFNLGIGSANPLDQYLEKSFQSKASEWVVVRVAADPILSIVHIASLAVTVYIAAKILIAHKEVRLKDAMRISALSMMSGAFLIIPWAGEIIAGVFSFLLLAFGIQGFYRISFMRSLMVIVFPHIVVSALLLLLVLVGAGVAIFSIF